MAILKIDNEKVQRLSKDEILAAVKLCPFSAIEEKNGAFEINAGCKMCGICVKKGPDGVFALAGEDTAHCDKSEWSGIAVYIDNSEGYIHPVSLELLGKAQELAGKSDCPVYALLMGHNVKAQAETLLHYGADEVFMYDNERLDVFLIEPYTNVFEDFVNNVKPSTVLVGATPVGRSLAPRAAARLKTGLTADCTKLDIKQNTDLVQIRPAFGGNIMAQIVTPNNRPQLATVRQKIFDAPEKSAEPRGKLTYCEIADEKLNSRIKVLSVKKKERTKTISEAEVIIAVGRGFRSEKDLAAARELAELLGAEMAGTRPAIEAGWVAANRQIGLSGRTVKPKLIITLGVSGSVQFKAGMENSDLIIAINSDENANIFGVSHYAVAGDIYDIVPKLVAKIREAGERKENV